MKKNLHLLLALPALLLISCNNGSRSGGVTTPLASSVTPQQLAIPKNEDMCFEQVSGNQNQDTLRVHLHFHGDQVTGTMANIPDGKDARTGAISGLLLQQDIKAQWCYTQEGIKDSVEVAFRLGDKELWQKPLPGEAAAPSDNTNGGFTQRIPLVDCR